MYQSKGQAAGGRVRSAGTRLGRIRGAVAEGAYKSLRALEDAATEAVGGSRRRPSAAGFRSVQRLTTSAASAQVFGFHYKGSHPALPLLQVSADGDFGDLSTHDRIWEKVQQI